MSSFRLADRLLATDGRAAALALRVPVGLIFAAHGAQKLFGWFGGYGIEGTAKWMDSIGLSPGILMTLTELLRDDPGAEEEAIRGVLSGHLCRCTGYQNIVDSMLAAAKVIAGTAP